MDVVPDFVVDVERTVVVWLTADDRCFVDLDVFFDESTNFDVNVPDVVIGVESDVLFDAAVDTAPVPDNAYRAIITTHSILMEEIIVIFLRIKIILH